MDKPQIIEHASKSLNYTVFGARWVPRSARLVAIGQNPRGTGAFEVYALSKGELVLQTSVSRGRREGIGFVVVVAPHSSSLKHDPRSVLSFEICPIHLH